MTTSAAVPANHPLMMAWGAYQLTEEYANSWRWAAKDQQYIKGALWAAFMEGFNAANAAQLPATEAQRKSEGGEG